MSTKNAKRRRVWIAGGLLALTLLTLAFVFGGSALRSTTRTVLERELGALLSGQVHIDRISELTLGHVLAEGVTVVDPQGRTVLRAPLLRLDLDLTKLPGGIRFSHGRMENPRIHAYPDDHVALSLFAAFVPKPSSGPPTPGEPFSVAFDDIHIENAELVGDVPGLKNVHVLDVFVTASIHTSKELEVRVTSLRGRMLAPYHTPVRIESGVTNVDTGPFRVATRAVLSRKSEHVTLQLHYTAPEKTADQLALQVALDPVTPDWVRELGLSLPETLIGELRGQVMLKGPTDHLTFAVAVQSEGGPLAISGKLPRGGTTLVHVESSRLSLPLLLAYAPPIDLSIAVDVRAAPGAPVDIQASVPSLDVFGIPGKNLTLHGSYKAGRFHIERSSVEHAGGTFHASGWVDENADFSLAVRSTVPDTEREQALRKVGFSAAIRAELTLTRKGDDFDARGSVALSHAEFRGLSAKQLTLEGHAHARDDFLKPDLDIHGQASELTVPGLLDGALGFTLHGGDGRYVANLNVKDPRGRSARAHAVFGELSNGWHVVLDPFELAVTGRDAWRAQADVVIDDDGVGLNHVLLASGPQRLEMSGRFSYSKAYRVDATLQSFDLGGLRELIAIDLADLDGTVDGTLALTGVPGHPRIDAQGSLHNGVFLGMTKLEVLLSLVFAEGRFDVESELVLPDGSRVSVYAGGEPGHGVTWGQQIASGNYQFGLDFEKLPFAVSKPWLEWLGIEPPGGNISAMVRGAGTFAAPELEVSSHVEKLKVGDYPAFDIDVHLKHDTATLDVDKLRVADVHGELFSASGNIQGELSELLAWHELRPSLATRPLMFTVHVPERRLDELPKPVQLEYPFFASAELSVTQASGGPAIELSSEIGFPPWQSGAEACGLVRHPELSIVARAQGNNATLEATGKVDQEVITTLHASAAAKVTDWITGKEAISTVPTKVTAKVNINASEEIPMLCRSIAGPLRAELTADDVFATPPVLRFTLDSNSLQFVPQVSQIQRLGNLKGAKTVGRAFALHASGGVEQERVAFIATVNQGKHASLELFGAIPRVAFRPGAPPADVEPIELRVRAQKFELAPVTIALPLDMRMSGQVDGDARVAYHLANAKIDLEGALDLSGARVALGGLGQELTKVNAALRMHDQTLHIESFSARDFSGQLNAEGDVQFDSLKHAHTDIGFKMSRFPLRREGTEVSKLNGEMRLRADITPERTRAELNISGIRVDLPNELNTDLQSLDPHPDIFVKGQAPEPPPEHPYLFELRMLANPTFQVRRTDLTADVLADLTMRYQSPALALEGSATLKRGSFELYGKRFDLQDSHMAFDGGDQLDPLVSLYATHKVGGDEIGVRVEGRLSNPTVTFSHSNPAITDTGEIIAELLGARRDDTSGTSQDATTAAAGMLAGATAGLLTQEVRQEFGGALPVFSIESGNQAFRSARIRAGVQLDEFVEKRLGPLRHIVRGAYIEGFVSPGADPEAENQNTVPQSRGGGLLELRFPRDFLGSVEYRPVQNWRIDAAWEP